MKGISRRANSKRNKVDQHGTLDYDGQPAGKTQLAAALPMDSSDPFRTDKSAAHDTTPAGTTVLPVEMDRLRSAVRTQPLVAETMHRSATLRGTTPSGSE
jgi:hypothetical protein